jgi:hypothetical protein
MTSQLGGICRGGGIPHSRATTRHTLLMTVPSNHCGRDASRRANGSFRKFMGAPGSRTADPDMLFREF